MKRKMQQKKPRQAAYRMSWANRYRFVRYLLESVV